MPPGPRRHGAGPTSADKAAQLQLDDLDLQLEVLRDQLDAAFDEFDQRLEAAETRASVAEARASVAEARASVAETRADAKPRRPRQPRASTRHPTRSSPLHRTEDLDADDEPRRGPGEDVGAHVAQAPSTACADRLESG